MSARDRARIRWSVGVFSALLGVRPAAAQELPPAVPSSYERVEDNALFAGLRLGVFVPYGSLYSAANFATTPFQHVATGGPVTEIELGARFERHFVGYAFFEQVWLGRGSSSAWTTPHGGQSGPSTQAIGIGLRWISSPRGLGFLADAGLGYRWFSARWADTTTVQMRGLGDVRIGVGANWWVARHLAFAPMVTLYTGAFSDRTLDGQPLGASASSYVAAALSLGTHLDY